MRILITEDDPAIRQLLAVLLRKGGHEIDQVPDGARAIEHLRRDEYDLCVLDLMMTDGSGFDVLQWLRANDAPMLRRCIVVTAAGPREIEMVPEAVFRIIRKPFDVDVLMTCVQDAAALLPPSLPRSSVPERSRDA